MTNAVIATTPQAMIEAQSQVGTWVDDRMAEAKRELALAEQAFNALQKAGLRVHPASAQIRLARKRIGFYEKVRAALAAGYYIIPPFDVQLFAIRTDREAPREDRSTRRWVGDETAPALPVGEGSWVDPRVPRVFAGSEEKKVGDKMVTTEYFANGAFPEVTIPVKAIKAELIEASARAMGERIFDALGIAPAYRSADPIIVGQIKHFKPGRGPLTFFVAWWLDRDDL